MRAQTISRCPLSSNPSVRKIRFYRSRRRTEEADLARCGKTKIVPRSHTVSTRSSFLTIRGLPDARSDPLRSVLGVFQGTAAAR